MTGTRPGEGERRAIGGYYPQYRLAALLILRALREDRLRWIRIADPDAGRVDDLQIGSENRVDAYQAKWSQYDGSFTYRDLKCASGDSPSLIRQLADGWQRLRERSRGERVVVHLVTNNGPSVHDRVPTGNPRPKPCHFASFLEQAWSPAKAATRVGDLQFDGAWDPAWKDLLKSSGLSALEFGLFLQDCEVEFRWQLPNTVGRRTRDQLLALEDVDQITQVLFGAVSDPARIVELSRGELIERLGWKARLEYPGRHMFPVDEALYQPIPATQNRLESVLSSRSGGYLAVLGTPGSGKSTFLTQFLRSRPERVIRYYVYVPDSRDPTGTRGESVNFLHDVVLALEDAGFRTGEGTARFDQDQLLHRLHLQLGRLHEEYVSTGRKTIILIDGLDHITREQRPTRALFNDLPAPEQIPDGVYFLIGSQTDAPLPDRIQYEVRQPERRIEMQPLSRRAVGRIIALAQLAARLSRKQRDLAYQLSAGHPLALRYLLKRLKSAKDAKDAQDVDTVLSSTERYQGSIEAEYYSYWRQLRTVDYELSQLLGRLARLRGPMDLSWVQEWVGRAVVDRLVESAGHYFRREGEGRWYFFHNSFRVFLVGQSAESSPGQVDPIRDREFHRELAERCLASPPNSYWAWEELYHLSRAGEHDTVLLRASQDWFRDQLLALRPTRSIRGDIQLALESAAAKQDPVALARLMLIGAEMAERDGYLDFSSLASLMVRLDEIPTAIQYLRDGNRLEVEATEALRVSVELRHAGAFQEAERIFDLAEPTDILAAGSELEGDPLGRDSALLERWAEAAVHFQDTDSVIRTTLGVRRVADQWHKRDADEETRLGWRRMLVAAGVALIEEQRWDDLATIGRTLESEQVLGLHEWLGLLEYAWQDRLRQGDDAQARRLLEEALRVAGGRSLPVETRIGLAEGCYRVLGDSTQAAGWLDDATQPEIPIGDVSYEAGFRQFGCRFRLNRLLYALGSRQTPAEIVHTLADPRHDGIVQFERGVCKLAWLWAESWKGHQIDVPIIMHEIDPLLNLFNRPREETIRSNSWPSVVAAQAEFSSMLVRAVRLHSPEARDAIRQAFEIQWDCDNTSVYWPANVRRQVILALQEAGAPRGWARYRLEALEGQMLVDQDISGRVKECEEQGKAWLELGDTQKARRAIGQMLRTSFGLGYRKDYQFDSWIQWLGRVNAVEPEQAAERTALFGRAIVALEKSTEGRALFHAVKELLEVTFAWSPRRSVLLRDWFTEHQMGRHSETAGSILQAAARHPTSRPMPIAIAIGEVVLPFSTEADSVLVQLTVERAGARGGTDLALEVAAYLLRELQTNALPSTRPDWRQGVARGLVSLGTDLGLVGLSAADLRPLPDEASWNILKLRDGTTASLEEVLLRTSTASDLLSVLQTEAEDSYFNWRPVITHLADQMDRGGIADVASIFRARERPSDILSVLAERLLSLGDCQGAWSLGLDALAFSDSLGWSEYWGNSRVAAFRALTKIDADRARTMVYETLLRDLTHGSWYPREVALNLDEILPLVTMPVPVVQVWNEVEQHVKALLSSLDFSSETAGLEALLRPSPSHDSPEASVVDLLAEHMGHPVNQLSSGALRGCGMLLLQGSEHVRAVVSGYLQATEEKRQVALMLLDAVSSRDPEMAVPFQDQLLALSTSPNYTIREIARTICSRIGRQTSEVVPPCKVLPLVYGVFLPSRGSTSLVHQGRIPPGRALPDSDNPVDIVRPHGDLAWAVAEEAGLSFANICYRAVELMLGLAPKESWNAEGEMKLRRILDSSRLGLSFRRPRFSVARRAMFHVVAELIDIGVLTEDNLRRLESILRHYDPDMLLREPEVRPSYISPIEGLSRYGEGNGTWLDRLDGAIHESLCLDLGGMTVLAEQTFLKRLDWSTPTESRLTAVSVRAESLDLRPEVDKEHFFARVTNRLITEYPQLLVEGSPTPLVIRHTGLGFDSPGDDWVALNPGVGRDLGWTHVQTGLFRWEDAKGQVVVESIWWEDGLLGQSPPHLHDEVGEGWLVLASPAAFAQLAARYGPLVRRVHVEREYHEDGKPRSRFHLSKSPL